MNSLRAPRQSILGGTVRVFGAELFALPTGLVTAVFLSRQFGPSNYGLYSLAAVLVTWLEWTLTSIFSRAAIKFIGEADDWMPVSAAVLRWYAVTSCAAAVLLGLLAEPISSLLGKPGFANYLRLFAIDIPIFSLAQAHRNILIGVGRFAERAWMSATRWLARLVLIVLLVGLGWGIAGAIIGSIGASLLELLVGRWHIRPALFQPAGFPIRTLSIYAIPLFLYSMTLGFYDKLGLFALQALGGTAEQAGFYSAAQNLTIVPSVLAAAFSPLLLAALARALHDGDVSLAQVLSRNAMRGVILLLPFAGMTVGISSEVVTLILGQPFLPAAPLLAWLIFGALALLMLSVTTAALTAAGKPQWTFGLAGVGLPFAVIGYLITIPRLTVQGAAITTTLAAWLAAFATLWGIHRVWRITPPWKTAFRAIAISALAYGESVFWATPGVLLLLKIGIIVLSIGIAFFLLGEFDASEMSGWLEKVRAQVLLR
jgi:O-antigen/teichoic acid export membrane protein